MNQKIMSLFLTMAIPVMPMECDPGEIDYDEAVETVRAADREAYSGSSQSHFQTEDEDGGDGQGSGPVVR